MELLSPLLTGIVTKLAPVPGSNIQTDGAIVVREPSGLAVALVLVQEVKRDIGKANSEPSLQGAGYQARFWSCRLDSRVMQFTCCPAFLVSSRSNAQRGGALACLSPSSGLPRGGRGRHTGCLARHGQSLTASLPHSLLLGCRWSLWGPTCASQRSSSMMSSRWCALTADPGGCCAGMRLPTSQGWSLH